MRDTIVAKPNQKENPLEDKNQILKFQQSLLIWYRKHKRSMPWRDIKNPYYTWVSEIMLQQTRVDTVIPYFQRFIEKYPTVEDLAGAEDEDLLKLWEGLGYYSRVKNMKIAAKEVVEVYKGEFPKDTESLQGLKGIGEYTAGAIASIAFEQRAPAVDGNVLRVMTRITGNKGDIKLGKTKKEITEKVRALLPEKNLGDFNQGLIELGAVICTSGKAPKCLDCPVSRFCTAFEKNLQGEIPVKSKAIKKRLEKKTVLILKYGDKIFIRKREGRGLLAGLWEFPNLEGHLKKPALSRILENESFLKEENLEVYKITRLTESKAVFSHIQWNLIAYQVELGSKESSNKNSAVKPPRKNLSVESGNALRIQEKNPLLQEISKDLLEDGRWVSKEKIKEEYSIASAFKAYRKEVL